MNTSEPVSVKRFLFKVLRENWSGCALSTISKDREWYMHRTGERAGYNYYLLMLDPGILLTACALSDQQSALNK